MKIHKHTACAYHIKYNGTKHPMHYFGSTYISKILYENYMGSPTSKKWADIVKQEMSDHPELYTIKILQTTETREEATSIEKTLQVMFNVVKSELFWNEALATANGCFGMDVSGKNNPMFGTSRSGKANPFFGKRQTAKSRAASKRTFTGMVCALNTDTGELEHISKILFDSDEKYVGSNTGNKATTGYILIQKDLKRKSVKLKDSIWYLADGWKPGWPGVVYEPKTCPHCTLSGGGGNMIRYHFDNCDLHPKHGKSVGLVCIIECFCGERLCLSTPQTRRKFTMHCKKCEKERNEN